MPGSISDISGSKGLSERSDQGEKFQFDPKEKPPGGFYIKMERPRRRKPGKIAMVPRKGENIFAKKKGRDLWYLYKYLGKGTKNTREGIRNPWMNVKTVDGEEAGF